MTLLLAILTAIGIAGPQTALEPAVRAETKQIGPPPPTVPLVPENALCGEWWATALDAGWQESELPEIDRIMHRESQCQPGAVNHNANGTIDRGLMQVNSVHRSWLADYGITLSMLFDPWNNLRAARLLFERAGWRPWRATT